MVQLMYKESDGLVLSTIKYNDTSDIVEVYTRAEGRISFVVQRSRGRRGGVRSVLFRPLMQLHITWNPRSRTGLYRIREAVACAPYLSIPYDPIKASVGLFLGEFLHRALRYEDDSEALYEYVSTALNWYDATTEGVANFHLVFLMRLTRFLGFYPDAAYCSDGAYFDLMAGTFTALQPLHSHFVQPTEAAVIPTLMRMTFDTMHVFRLNRASRTRLLDALVLYYRLHLPDFPELKSLSVLRELFLSA